MVAPNGISSTIPPQADPQLEARAAREREDLPKLPNAPDPETYSNLGTVPPKPTLPSEADIAGQVKSLASEQQAGAAAIATQADAPEPQTLPKPGKGTPSETQPALVYSPATVPILQPPQAPFLSGAAPLEAEESQVFSQDNQAFLPQSQIEATDRISGAAP